ncbi:MAG: hypothetical protein KF800_18655 [Lysobacter sp.]|nr:hypothetical protein [Lysobacter sp.]
MNDMRDSFIDALLRKHSADPVADDGFCDRVMRRLPARRRVRRWQLPVAMAAGLGACLWSLSSAFLIRAGWEDWMGGIMSSAAVIMLLTVVGTSLLASWWALSESH